MKNRYFIILIIVSALFFGCAKNPLDQRTKYTGNWRLKFTVTYIDGTTYDQFKDVTIETVHGASEYPFDHSLILIDGLKCHISTSRFHDHANFKGAMNGKFIDKNNLVIDVDKEATNYSGWNVELSYTGKRK